MQTKYKKELCKSCNKLVTAVLTKKEVYVPYTSAKAKIIVYICIKCGNITSIPKQQVQEEKK